MKIAPSFVVIFTTYAMPLVGVKLVGIGNETAHVDCTESRVLQPLNVKLVVFFVPAMKKLANDIAAVPTLRMVSFRLLIDVQS